MQLSRKISVESATNVDMVAAKNQQRDCHNSSSHDDTQNLSISTTNSVSGSRKVSQRGPESEVPHHVGLLPEEAVDNECA